MVPIPAKDDLTPVRRPGKSVLSNEMPNRRVGIALPERRVSLALVTDEMRHRKMQSCPAGSGLRWAHTTRIRAGCRSRQDCNSVRLLFVVLSDAP